MSCEKPRRGLQGGCAHCRSEEEQGHDAGRFCWRSKAREPFPLRESGMRVALVSLLDKTWQDTGFSVAMNITRGAVKGSIP